MPFPPIIPRKIGPMFPVTDELVADAEWFQRVFDRAIQELWYAVRFNEHPTPVMASIEGTPAHWDSRVWVEEEIDYSFGGNP
jgi:hypothetical protein